MKRTDLRVTDKGTKPDSKEEFLEGVHLLI